MTLTVTTTPGQYDQMSYSNEGVSFNPIDFLNKSLTRRPSLISILGNLQF